MMQQTFMVQPDPVRGGVLIVRASPADLTSVPFRLSQAIGDPADMLAVHALHHNEQDIPAHSAYQDERRELGTMPPPMGPQVEVVELARPHKQNVVYVDRNHLLVTGARLDIAHRLLGLYVSSKGQIHLLAHHPSVTHQVGEALRMRLDEFYRDRQLPDGLLAMTRYAVWYDEHLPDAVRVWVPPMYAPAVMQALQ